MVLTILKMDETVGEEERGHLADEFASFQNEFDNYWGQEDFNSIESTFGRYCKGGSKKELADLR